jgi:hypothetical protein
MQNQKTNKQKQTPRYFSGHIPTDEGTKHLPFILALAYTQTDHILLRELSF